MVDTAVLGHMSGSHYLAGSAIAGLIITQLYWLCSFIRMSSTGLSAQAKGQHNPLNASKVLYQSLGIALSIAALLLIMQGPLLSLGLYFIDSSAEVVEVVQDYFHIRILGAPAALANLALIGWLIGQQQTKQVLLVQVIANLLNGGLSITLVFGLGMGVSGVAAASVFAEYFIFASSLYFALQVQMPKVPQAVWFKFRALKSLIALNGHTFIRNLSLQLCIAFLVFQGAKLGPMTAATNAILMQFFSLIALGLDGIAYAVEALVGEAKGKSSQRQVTLVTLTGLFYSALAALLYSLLFVIAGSSIIALLSDQEALQTMATSYLPVIWLLPLLAHWCFLLDGVFVGLTRAKAMQNSMLLSAGLFYILAWFWVVDYGNWGLWAAMLVFMLVRGLSLGLYFNYLRIKGSLLT